MLPVLLCTTTGLQDYGATGLRGYGAVYLYIYIYIYNCFHGFHTGARAGTGTWRVYGLRAGTNGTSCPVAGVLAAAAASTIRFCDLTRINLRVVVNSTSKRSGLPCKLSSETLC